MQGRWGRIWQSGYPQATAVVGLATGGCLVLRRVLGSIDVAMVMLLGVVAVSARYRRGPALLASLLSIAAFDFLFVPPYYRFSVHDSAYYLTFVVMLAVALTMSQLTTRIREHAEDAAERERRTALLYALDRELAGAADVPALIAAAERRLGDLAGGTVGVLRDTSGGERPFPGRSDGVFASAEVRMAATFALERGEPAGWSTRRGAEAEALVAPLRTASGSLGLVTIAPADPTRRLNDWERETVLAMVDLTASALERRLLAEDSEHARRAVEAERLRTALLSSLSHDLRTPLAGIEGAATSLLEDSGALPEGIRRELLESIVEESRRMTRLVNNLLDMIRVETGTLAVRKSWQPLEEALGVALLRLDERLRGHPVTTRLPSDLPLVPVDELLLEQVFINLLENAIRHTPPGTSVEVAAHAENGCVVVEVADRGPGIAAGEEEVIFGRFYRGAAHAKEGEAGGAGAGLGLTICRGIVTAHDGRIWAEQRVEGGGGLRIVFTLPLNGPPPAALPAEPSEG